MPNKELETLKKQVEYCLEHFPGTRNCDKLLTWTIWKKFYNAPDSIGYLQFLALPSEQSVRRFRAWIQNHPANPRFLPTDEKVVIQRRLNLERWRELMLIHPELFKVGEMNG